MRGAPDAPGQREIVISPRLLIRLHKDGTLDEIVTHDENGECDFHLEQMDKMQWWMRFYSTKARPLPRELIGRIGPSGAIHEFDGSPNYEDEKYYAPEDRTPPENITHAVDHFIRYYGMKRLLQEMVGHCQRAKEEERSNWPERDTAYLDDLVENLGQTLDDYEDRYPGEPDIYDGAWEEPDDDADDHV